MSLNCSLSLGRICTSRCCRRGSRVGRKLRRLGLDQPVHRYVLLGQGQMRRQGLLRCRRLLGRPLLRFDGRLLGRRRLLGSGRCGGVLLLRLQVRRRVLLVLFLGLLLPGRLGRRRHLLHVMVARESRRGRIGRACLRLLGRLRRHCALVVLLIVTRVHGCGFIVGSSRCCCCRLPVIILIIAVVVLVISIIFTHGLILIRLRLLRFFLSFFAFSLLLLGLAELSF